MNCSHDRHRQASRPLHVNLSHEDSRTVMNQAAAGFFINDFSTFFGMRRVNKIIDELQLHSCGSSAPPREEANYVLRIRDEAI